jgi:hypothetical protein
MGKVTYRGRLVRIEQYTCLVVPADEASPLGNGYRVPVIGTINGYPVRTSVFHTRDGDRMLIVNKDMQRGSNLGLDDDVTVVLKIDDDRRGVTIPPDLAKALLRTRSAKAAFEKLPLSHQHRYLGWIDEAKRPETRARRIEQTVERLLAQLPAVRKPLARKR